MATTTLHYIDEEFVRSNLSYTDLIPAVEDGMASFSSKDDDVVQPVRTKVSAEKHNGEYFIMPVFSYKRDVFCTKIVSVYPNNASKGIPSHQSMIWLYDGSTAVLKATIHADGITEMRTAAASAVATKYLAPENSKVHTIMGAGAQAHSHLEALAHVCNFVEVRVWNHNYVKAEAFAKKHGCKAYQSAEEAVRGADVISTVTMSSTPVLSMEWVKPGAHINAVGAPVPSNQEIDPALMKAAVVYADSRDAACVESGDVIKSKATIYAEIGEVIMGSVEAKRQETTIFKSLGLAIEDLVAAKLVYDKQQQSYNHT